MLAACGLAVITRVLVLRDQRAQMAANASAAARGELPQELPWSARAVTFETELTSYVLVAVLLVAMTWCGQVAVSRIVRAGPPLLGLSWALFFAWIAPLVVFNVCAWFGPGLTGQDDPLWMNTAPATILLVPLNIAFVVLVYRRALHQARGAAA